MTKLIGTLSLGAALLLPACSRQPQTGAEPMTRARLEIQTGPWLGDKSAPVTIVEFADYQCGFCRQFHLRTFPEIRKKYIDTGQVRFVSRDLPLGFHANALRAAEAARCAGDQGQFWPMRDTLITNAGNLSEAAILSCAGKLGLKRKPFRSCLTSGKYRQAIQSDLAEASALHIDGTPTFIVGKSTAEGVDGVLLEGSQPLQAFEAVLKRLP